MSARSSPRGHCFCFFELPLRLMYVVLCWFLIECVCVCVFVRERERKYRTREREHMGQGEEERGEGEFREGVGQMEIELCR